MPALIFQTANTLALVAWLALLLSLFWPRARPLVWPATGLVVPAVVGAVYVALLVSTAGEAEGAGFGSIEQVRALFAHDAGLTAGWLHYIAFDLFVGTWIARDGVERGVSGWLIAPCLVLCFLFGPAGLLLYLLLRLGRRA